MFDRRCKFEVLWTFFGPAIYWWVFLKDVFNFSAEGDACGISAIAVHREPKLSLS